MLNVKHIEIIFFINVWLVTMAYYIPHNNFQNEARSLKNVLKMLIDEDEIMLIISDENSTDYLPRNINNPIVNWNIDKGDIPSENENFYYVNRVIFIANVTKFYKLLDYLRSEIFQMSGSKSRSNKFFVFITNQTFNKTDILKHFWKNDILNVILFERNELLDFWYAYTYFPYTEESQCGNIINPSLINIANFTFNIANPNLKYCTFNVSCVDIEMKSKSFYEPPYRFTVPLIILKERNNLNFSLFSMPLDYQENPLLSTYQMKEELYTKEYDAIAVIPFREYDYIAVYDKKVELSNILFYDKFMWFVWKPERIPYILLFLKIFPLHILLLCLLTFFVSYAMWILIARIKQIDMYNATGFFAINFGSGIGKLPKSNIMKFLFVFYIFYFTHINYFYQGNLSSKLLIPQYNEGIKDIEDLIDSKYTMQLVDVERQLLFPSDHLLEQRYYRKVYSMPPLVADQDDCNKIINENIKTSSIRNSILSSTYNENCSQHMDIIDDEIAPQLVYTYAIRFGHPLLIFIDRIIVRLNEHGFVVKWIYSYVKSEKNNICVENSSLTLKHIQGALISLFIGLFLGLLIFLTEIFCNDKISKS